MYKNDIQKRYYRGKLIVYIIAICNIIVTLLSNIYGDFNIINIIIQIGLSIALLTGKNWARWLFVFGAISAVLFVLYILPSIANMGSQVPIILVVLAIEPAISGSLLIFNKSVSEFFYDKQTK